MGKLQSLRKQLGFRSLFNLLGPLTNPADATHHLIGVYDEKWLYPFAKVLQELGSQHALIVHSMDGMDEISLAADSHVVELRDGKIETTVFNPENYGFQKQSLQHLKVNNAHESLSIFHQVLNNEPGPARDIVILNAGAAIYAADLTDNLKDAFALAKEMIASGAALKKFQDFITFTQTS
jgi:anthranilate phosphoribosyltransferase